MNAKSAPLADDQRTSREIDERANQAREPETFVPPGLLPDFKQDPQYAYRWIRVSTFGDSDAGNVDTRFREGWSPVRAEDHPEIASNVFFKRKDLEEQFPGMIVRGGLILCKASKEKIKARKEYYEKITAAQMTAVDNDFFKENDPRAPLFRERKTVVTRRGR